MILGIDDVKQFKVFFDVIHEDTSVIEFQVFNDKIICSVLNKSHTNFYKVTFSREFFSVYDVGDVELFSVDIDDLYKLLKSIKTGDLLLEVNGNYLVATVTSPEGNRRIFEYVLQDNYSQIPQFPTIVFDTEFEVNTVDLNQSVTDLNLIGTDRYKMAVNGDSLFISSSEDSMTKYSHEIYIDPEIPTKMISSVYYVDYIEKILKFNKVNKVVEIEFGDTKPLKYTYNGDNVLIEGLIAPLLVEE